MENLLVEGKNRLNGEVQIAGMKNSALPIIYSTLLIDGESIIHNIPRVSDVENSLEILRKMGATAEFCDKNTIRINTKNAFPSNETYALISKMRASYYLLGASLSRFKEITIPMPGGCNFGARPIEQHLKGFQGLGASCIENNENVTVKALSGLKSNKITLDKISVGATINMVLASVLIPGVTTIENVAIEPHIDDLICFLNKCGAKIIRYGRRIYVVGVSCLKAIEHRIFPDMIEALTYMCFLGACGGEILLKDVFIKHLTYELDMFQEMGYFISTTDNTVLARVDKKLKGVDVETNPYPLFPTDLQPQFSALLCFTSSGGEVIENIYKTRFAYVNELIKMGAKIELKNGVIRVFPSELKGSVVKATDLRAGAALITAALGSYGATEINNVKYIVRGYERITEKIASIGGKIKII